MTTPEDKLAAIDQLRGCLKDRHTPESVAKAEARKQLATENLERLYASKVASTTEIRAAEREWELADDELDSGPFPEQ